MPPDPDIESRPACQICYEGLTGVDEPSSRSVTSMVSHICSASCPAVVCISCLRRHLQVAMKVPYASALPKIRCLKCLKLLNKQQWGRFLDPDNAEDTNLLTEYTRLAECSCVMTCPDCEDDEYVHLPKYLQTVGTVLFFLPPRLIPSQKAFLLPLRKLVRQFCYHRKGVTGRDVVQYVGRHFSSAKVELLVLCVLQRIKDDERRAALQLAYLNLYPRTLTMCCLSHVCFNCKRELKDDSSPCTCETQRSEEIGQDNCVQCRSCRVLLVKVEGCNEVHCPCGFTMNWEKEISVQKRRLP